MQKSWWKRATGLLIAILLSALLFFLWTSFNVTGQIRRTVEEENSNSLRLWAADLESRAEAMYEHIYELIVTLHNSNELRTGTPVMDAMTKRKIVDMMEEKLIVSADADAFFVFDTENSFYIFSARTGMDGREVLAMKEYLRDNGQSWETPFRDKRWQIIRVGQNTYFEKGVRMGKYLVGALSNTRYFNMDTKFSVLGEEASLLLTSESEEVPLLSNPGSPGGYRISTVSTPVPLVSGQATLTVKTTLSLQDRIILPILLLVNSAVCLILIFFLLRLLRKKVAKPSQELIQANAALAGGNLDYRLDAAAAGSREFETLFDSFNEMASQITKLRIEAYDLKLQEDANRLTMLRAQIKPHSFLNAVTTISNLTYICEPEEVRAYIGTFAKFIRYMLNVNDPWISLSGELAHVRNYLQMQEIRFPGCIRLTEDCDEDTLRHEIPFLLLYTLVENSIKHAMTLYETLDIRIQCRRIETPEFQGISLTEEDSGEGFTEEALEQLMKDDAVFTKEHLGLSNVRYTLNLLYHRSDLLRISNRENGGACVEIRIPDREEKP